MVHPESETADFYCTSFPEERPHSDSRWFIQNQKQRISIARAFLKNAPILILDEPTSALDGVSEAQIKEALTRLMAGRITLIVAHRLTTIEHADQILALTDGRIVESGSWQELIERNGLFAKLCRLQGISAKGEQEDAA